MTAIEKLAERFAKASREGARIPLAKLEAEGLIPGTLAEGMAAQRDFAGYWGKPVAGWKLAIRPDGEAVGAPMFDCCEVNEANVASFPLHGTEGIEVEICFTLSADIPAAAEGPLTRADLMRYIDEVHLGVELLRYRLAEKIRCHFRFSSRIALPTTALPSVRRWIRALWRFLPVMAIPCRSSLSQRNQWNFLAPR